MKIDDALLDPTIRWVVAYVGHWKPREVVDYLERVGYAPYCPQEQRVQVRARVRGPQGGQRGTKVVSKPLFGGYLFVGEHALPLSRSTHPRIFDILGDVAGPFYVDSQALRSMRALELAGEWDYTRGLSQRFPPGKRVVIKRGHFAEFEAIVASVEASGKLKLRLNLFGRQVETVVDASRVAA